MNPVSTRESTRECDPEIGPARPAAGPPVAPVTDLQTLTEGRFDSWSDFLKHLAKRKTPTPHRLWGGRQSALAWACPEEVRDKDFQRACKLLDGRRAIRKKDVRFLAWTMARANEGAVQTGSVSGAYRAMALAWLLPPLASVSPADDWCRAVAALTEVARSAAEPHALVRQMTSVELPLMLACQFPEIPACQALAETAFDVLLVEQEELLDTDGALQSTWCSLLPALLATWTRSLILARRLGYRLDKPAQEKWEWFVRFAMRLLRRDGTCMLGDPGIAWNADLYQAAVKTSTDRDDRAIARLVLPQGNPRGKKLTVFVDNGCYSPWAGLGVLQTDWSPKSARVAVAVDRQNLRLEVCRGRPLFQITGLPAVSVNGKPLQPVSEWEDVCWHADEDVDYLELEIDLADGVRLQRQICLVRADEALFLADAVLGVSQERMDYQLTLELPDSIIALPETENTELYLRDQKIRSLLLPLGMSEWKSARHDDRFESPVDHRVAMSRSRLAQNLYAGLFVDLSPKRSVRPRTWRSLTVGESLEIVSPDTAQAFRVRIGNRQWVMYRSLAEVANRTFLGQNHNCEFFIGRFQEDGNVQELLSIET